MAQSSHTPEEKAYEDLARAEMRTVLLNAATWTGPTCQTQWKLQTKKLERNADDMAANLAKPAPFVDELTECVREDMAGASVEDLERKRDCLRHTMTVQLMMRFSPDHPTTALYVATTTRRRRARTSTTFCTPTCAS